MSETIDAKEVEQRVERLNARAVAQRMEIMQAKLDEYHEVLKQQAQRIAMLENRFTVEQQLRSALAQGSGPTVRED